MKNAALKLGTMVAGFSVAFASPAFAHELVIHHSKDRGWVGPKHHAVKITDHECDSHNVWILWQETMTLGVFSVKDHNGCKPGGTYGLARHKHKITSAQVCEYWDEDDRWNCTDWYKA